MFLTQFFYINPQNPPEVIWGSKVPESNTYVWSIVIGPIPGQIHYMLYLVKYASDYMYRQMDKVTPRASVGAKNKCVLNDSKWPETKFGNFFFVKNQKESPWDYTASFWGPGAWQNTRCGNIAVVNLQSK